MKSAHIKITALSLFLVLSFVFAPQQVNALTISPAKIEVSVNPGSVVQEDFLIMNEQQDTMTFYTSAENFEAQGETGTPFFIKEDKGLDSWITVDKSFTLKRGEQKTVKVSVNVPKDAEPGGHFAAIFLSTTPPDGPKGQVSVGAKIGVLLLLRVNGDIKEGGGVIEFAPTHNQTYYTSLPVSFFYRFNNTGNDRLRPRGDVVIDNVIGWNKTKFDANPEQGNVLPSSVRRFELAWGSSEDAQIKRNFFQEAVYQAKHFAFGAYNIKLALDINQTKNSSFTVYVFPWQLFIFSILILIIVGGVLKVLIRHYNQWIIKQAQKQNQIPPTAPLNPSL